MRLRAWVRALVLIGGMTVSAAAEDIMIDFLGLTPGGYISYGGHSAPLVGSNIPINRMAGFGTPSNDALTNLALNPGSGGAYTVESGVLNFQTGGFTYRETDGTFLFSGGGFFTITGAVRNNSGGYIVSDPSTVLLYGGLLGAQFDRVGSVKMTIVNGSDTKHPDVVSWFGLPTTSRFAFSGTITSRAQADAAGRYPVLGSNILNTVVPEPATITLLGTIICFLGSKLYKKSSRALA